MKHITTETDEQIIQRWRVWIHEILVEAQNLLTSQSIYHQYLEIVKANSEIQQPPRFHNWVRKNYATSIAMHIRRELGEDNDEVSLAKLLCEIKSNSRLITKQIHAELYKGSNAEGYADATFESLAGLGESFDGGIAKTDLKKLREIGKHIQNYATNRLAHSLLSQPLIEPPTYDDLDKFIEEYHQILKRYVCLFTGSGYPSLTPVPQYDWEEIFTKPWINKRLDDFE